MRSNTGEGNTSEEIKNREGGDVGVVLSPYEEGGIPHLTEVEDTLVEFGREKVPDASVAGDGGGGGDNDGERDPILEGGGGEL